MLSERSCLWYFEDQEQGKILIDSYMLNIDDITMHALINKQHLYKYVYEIKLLMLESGCARKLNQEHKTTKAR